MDGVTKDELALSIRDARALRDVKFKELMNNSTFPGVAKNILSEIQVLDQTIQTLGMEYNKYCELWHKGR